MTHYLVFLCMRFQCVCTVFIYCSPELPALKMVGNKIRDIKVLKLSAKECRKTMGKICLA